MEPVAWLLLGCLVGVFLGLLWPRHAPQVNVALTNESGNRIGDPDRNGEPDDDDKPKAFGFNQIDETEEQEEE